MEREKSTIPTPGAARLRTFGIVIGLGWFLAVVGSFFWETWNQRGMIQEMVRTEARASLRKDIALGRWSAQMGGVYIRPSTIGSPTRYTHSLSEPGIEVASVGPTLLLHPPDLMKIVQQTTEVDGILDARFITLASSAASPSEEAWFAESLELLKSGYPETSTETTYLGQPVIRMMYPIRAEPECLTCHIHRNRKAGEFWGGISLAVPLGPFLDPLRASYLHLALSHLSILFLGWFGVWGVERYLRVMVVREVTTKAALDREKERGKSILDVAGVMMVALDTQGRVTLANHKAAEVLGYPPEEIEGKDWFSQFLPAEDREEVKRVFLQMCRGEVSPIRYHENPIRTSKGETRLVAWHNALLRDPDGKITGTLSSGEDITDRRRAEEDLRHLRNLLSNIVDSMPSILIGVNREGRITHWNRKAAGLEPTPSPTLGLPLETAFPSLARFGGKVRDAMQKRETQVEPKTTLFVEGATRSVDLTVYPLIGDELEGAVLRIDDVTERQRLEEMMIQSEKMMSVGGLAAGMAHEINNPIAGILQGVQVALTRLTADFPANTQAASRAGTSVSAISQFMQERRIIDILENIQEAGARASRIVSNMLTFARKSPGSFAPHSLFDILDAAIELLQAGFDLKRRYDYKGIRIEREFQATTPPVPCDRGMIQQVFLNILKNGAEAMCAHREALPEAARHEYTPQFRIRVCPAGNRVRVEIADNGPGMDETIRRRIFEPFFTTKPVDQGTGLGLSVSFFIVVNHHGGELTVESAPNQGALFVIELPLLQRPDQEERG